MWRWRTLCGVFDSAMRQRAQRRTWGARGLAMMEADDTNFAYR
jgi:hypothetical protein